MIADSISAAGGLNILIEYGYDGTAYYGSQVQPDKPTVSGAIEDALAVLYGRRIPLCTASRTDKGVHARRTIANFPAPAGYGPKPGEVARALNAYLPSDIRVKRAMRVSAGFNSRRHSTLKEYRYYWREVSEPDVLESRYRAYFKERSDRRLVAEGLESVCGEHSFERFCRRSGEREDYLCRISKAEFKESGSRCEIRIAGDRFLYQMVRRIVGSLYDVGCGKLGFAEFMSAVSGKGELPQVSVAPACGLILWKVYFAELSDEQNNSYE